MVVLRLLLIQLLNLYLLLLLLLKLMCLALVVVMVLLIQRLPGELLLTLIAGVREVQLLQTLPVYQPELIRLKLPTI